MNPHVGHGTQPFVDFNIGTLRIQANTDLSKSCSQRMIKAALQIVVEPLHFALGLRSIGSAQSRQEPIVCGKHPKSRLKPMFAQTVGVTLQHNGLHVVEQEMTRNAAEECQCAFEALQEGVEVFVGGELHIARPTLTHCGDKGGEAVFTAPDLTPIDLHLFAWLGLKANHRIIDWLRLQ